MKLHSVCRRRAIFPPERVEGLSAREGRGKNNSGCENGSLYSGSLRKNALLQNPAALFVYESKPIARVRRVALIGPDYMRPPNVSRLSASQIHLDHGILLQRGRAATQEPASTDILGSTHFLEWFFIRIITSQIQGNSQANAHFASSLGLGGVQYVGQASLAARRNPPVSRSIPRRRAPCRIVLCLHPPLH